MTREDKAAYNYARERLDNDDYPVYSYERELERAFKAGIEYAEAHPNLEAIVKRLQEEITNDLRQDRWISVEDELPHGGVYLFCNSNGDVFIASDEIAFLYKNVTHWMPLPPPVVPKTETSASEKQTNCKKKGGDR